MERVTAHYSERMQHNQDQVGRDKESLRTWEMLTQNETQRIAEVIDLCSKHPPQRQPPRLRKMRLLCRPHFQQSPLHPD